MKFSDHDLYDPANVIDGVQVVPRDESIARAASALTRLRSDFGALALDAAIKESQRRAVQLCLYCGCETQHRDGICLACGRLAARSRCRPKGDGTR